jgi:predicted Zn-dependent peptidase
MVKKTTLKNGLRIVTIPQSGTRTVTVLVLVRTGSKNEDRETNGVSHFLEHMFFKGTTKRPRAVDVVEPLDQIGGAYNAFTSEDYTGYYAKVDASHLDLAMEWVSDIFLHSLLPPKEIQKEKGVVIEELHMHRDNPMSHVDTLWNKLLYGDQPAGWDIVGTKESVTALSRKQLLEYMKSQYVGSNTVVCVAGNVKEADVSKKARKLFVSIRAAKAREAAMVKENQAKPALAVEYRKTDQSNIVLGVRGYNLKHPMRHAQYLLATSLGGMMSSRLWLSIRERMGLAYYISTVSECNPDTGSLVTAAGIKNGSVEQAIRAVLLEYKRVKTTKLSTKELQKAKDHEKGKLALQLEPSDAKASFYGMQELLQGTLLTPEQLYDKIDGVTVGDVQEAARDIFRPEKLNLVILGPHHNKAKFAKLLRI